jgi:hypothetical protein
MGDMSAGRAAMWIIAGAITTALVAVLVVDGFNGIPWGWWGLIIGCGLAATAFGLGFYE